MEFEQIFNFFTSSDGKTTQCAVDFRHVGCKPFSIKLILPCSIKFRDLSGLTQFFNPTTYALKRDVSEFIPVEWIVEFTVKPSTVTHEAEQFLGVGWSWGFVRIVGSELLAGEFGGQ